MEALRRLPQVLVGSAQPLLLLVGEAGLAAPLVAAIRSVVAQQLPVLGPLLLHLLRVDLAVLVHP